jgi:hypothetical protein
MVQGARLYPAVLLCWAAIVGGEALHSRSFNISYYTYVLLLMEQHQP